MSPSNDKNSLKVVPILEAAAGLSAQLHPLTRQAISDIITGVQCLHFSQLAGRNIQYFLFRQIQADPSMQVDQKDPSLQEMKSYLRTTELWNREMEKKETCQPADLLWIHNEFCRYLPDDFRLVNLYNGGVARVVPGAVRRQDVSAGGNIKSSNDIEQNLQVAFAELNQANDRASKLYAILRLHATLMQVQPFLAANGPVTILYIQSLLAKEKFNAGGLLSFAAALLTHREEYDNWIGKPYTSENANEFAVKLGEWLETEISRLSSVLTTVNFMKGLRNLLRQSSSLHSRREIQFLLEAVFLSGSISKGDADRICGRTDKTIRKLSDQMIKEGWLRMDGEGKFARYAVQYNGELARILF